MSDILDLIDHALEDCSSGDAMRWTPEACQPDDLPGLDPQEFYRFLVDALHAARPAIRNSPGTHWIMDRSSYDYVRIMVRQPPGEPAPGDTLLGFPVTVTMDGGMPHLENP